LNWFSRNLTHLWWATCYSISGLRTAWRHEQAFRQEAAVLIVLAPAALWFGRDGVERALLLGSWMLVIIVELINTAIESAIDRIGSERHELAGRAKDLGSAGVFCAIALAVVVWVLVLFG
jgi:diacylglycerol kinase (ATP)